MVKFCPIWEHYWQVSKIRWFISQQIFDGVFVADDVEIWPYFIFVADDGEKMETEAAGIQEWKEAVKSAATLSRLHVLLGILDSCIKWEKSAEHAVSIDDQPN